MQLIEPANWLVELVEERDTRIDDNAFVDSLDRHLIRHGDALSERLSLRSTAQCYLQLAKYAVGLADKNERVSEYFI